MFSLPLLLPLCLAPAVPLGSATVSAQETAKRDDGLAEYQPPGEKLSEGVRKQLEGLDPSRTGWPTEVLHNLAKPRLAEFVELLAQGRTHELGRHLAPDFQGLTRLRPEDLITALDSGGLLVRRAPHPGSELLPASELPELVRSLLSPYRAGGSDTDGHSMEPAPLHLRSKSKIYTTDPDPSNDRLFSTMALVRLDGPMPDGHRMETNMEWLVTWDRMQGATVGIRSIQLALFDEIRAPGPLFEEITDAVLGRIPRYAEEFLRGSSDYHFRLDRMDGNVYTGQFGVAVGDVNGDDHDDIFVPQHGGLPNRLLLHLPDGTVQDVTESSGLGVLEETQSALLIDLDNDGDEDESRPDLDPGEALRLAEYYRRVDENSRGYVLREGKRVPLPGTRD